MHLQKESCKLKERVSGARVRREVMSWLRHMVIDATQSLVLLPMYALEPSTSSQVLLSGFLSWAVSFSAVRANRRATHFFLQTLCTELT